MEKYYSDPLWILGAIGWVVGIVSGYLQIKGYRQQNKMEQGYIGVLEQAKRDWQGKYTKEQIESMTKELKRLEESINKDVPQKARRVFLEDQLSTLTESIAQGFNRYNEMLVELKSYNKQLPEQVEHAIEQEIMPKYLEQQMQQKMLLSILGAFGAFLLFINVGYFYDSEILLYFLGTTCVIVVLNYSSGKYINNLVVRIGRKASSILGWSIIVVGALNYIIPMGLFFSDLGLGFGLIAYAMYKVTGSSFMVSLLIEWSLSAFAVLLVLRSRNQ